MDSVKGALRDLRRALVFTRLFHSFLNAFLIFLLFALSTMAFRVTWKYALIPTSLYLAYAIYRAIMKTRYKDIEETVPELRWQLRTISDNMSVDNEVVRSLKQNVLRKAKETSTSSFIDNRVTVYKIFGITTLSFAFVAFSAFSISFSDLRGVVPTGLISAITGKGVAIGEVDYDRSYERDSNKNIYGKEGVIAIGNEELELNVQPEQNQANLHDLQDTQEQAFDQRGVLKDIGARPDGSFEGDRIKKEESELIKNYLKKLTEYSNSERR